MSEFEALILEVLRLLRAVQRIERLLGIPATEIIELAHYVPNGPETNNASAEVTEDLFGVDLRDVP